MNLSIIPISNFVKSFYCGICNELLAFLGQNIFSEFPILLKNSWTSWVTYPKLRHLAMLFNTWLMHSPQVVVWIIYRRAKSQVSTITMSWTSGLPTDQLCHCFRRHMHMQKSLTEMGGIINIFKRTCRLVSLASWVHTTLEQRYRETLTVAG